ncbi:MAG: ATPase [Ignavibacteriae bacterium HGW-Ignavibacteriae-2]|jgi:potassium uptake TrkH family protein|nr:MAG: ATPase [Ignavibacteriae bacterium HGW-Ignavibacteriae-2]
MKKEKINWIVKLSRILIFITSALGLGAIIIEYGFKFSREDAVILHYISLGVVIVFILYQILHFFISESKKEYIKSHKIELIILAFIFAELILSFFDYSFVEKIGNVLHFKDIAYLYILFAQIIIIIGLILGGLRYNKNILQSKIHPSRLFILSFLATITIGALLLLLPAATVNGGISVVDAVFTSTSAVCVTGLITQDTATYFTSFGQIVILLLFQIGGLGLMTFTTFFAIFLSGGLGIKESIILHDLLDEENIGAITKVISFLTVTTFVIELLGAAILFFSIHQNYDDVGAAIFISIFHSVSAFCNAGFSLFTLNLMDNLVISNYLFTTTISILIILGGIGFPTIMSLWSKRIWTKLPASQKRFSIQTRIIVITTLALIVSGTVVFYLLELRYSLSGLDEAQKIHASYFQSVTSRTAGFNTIDFAKTGLTTSLFVLFLMFVGASPGGTGGGIKTTTFAIMILGTMSILRNQKHVTIGNRTIPREIILKAFIKTFFSIGIISAGILFLTISENKNLIDIMFESFSAFGTVGLSRGITGSLTDSGKLVITFLMFIGRVGPLAFIYSIMKPKEQPNYDFPSENISIL